MNLLVVSLSEGYGGAEIALIRQLRELTTIESALNVLCIAAPDRMVSAAAGVSCVEAHSLSPRYRDLLTTRKTVARHARTFNADVVLANGNRSIYLCRAMMLGLPLVAYQHCDLGVPSISRWRFLARRVLAKHVYDGCTKIACTSRRVMADLVDLGLGKRCVAMPNGVPMAETPLDRTRLRRIVMAQPSVPLVVQVGRLEPGKNPALTLSAIAEIPQSHGVFIGDGPLAEELKARAHVLGLDHRCSWLGYREDARELIAGADVLVLPSASETTPLCILEAMDAGVPVVASAVGGIPDLIEDEVHGLLMPSVEVSELTTRLARLLQDVPLGRRLSEAAMVRARSQFSMRASAKRFAEMLNDAMGKK